MATTSLKEAMAMLQADPEVAPPLESLAPSKLGTKEHWDEVYEREVKNFETIGDEGEVWFGEDSADDMVEWCMENCPPSGSKPRILDVGCGNGDLSFRLVNAGYSGVLGIDYSPASITLAQAIAEQKEVSSSDAAFAVRDLFTYDGNEEYDLICDKGTYDAISLTDEKLDGKALIAHYPAKVSKMLPPGGIFLITSCNWTKAELEKAFINNETGLKYHSHIPRPSFQFGGAVGQTITTVAFIK